MTKKHVLKAAAFLLLFAIAFYPIGRVFSRPQNDHNYHMIAGFYEEPENSLDAVYIGSSNCFVFWNSAAAWQNYGIAVYPYACDSLPFVSTTYMMAETRKTQPDALYIVNLNTLHDTKVLTSFSHYFLSGMPMSANKLALISRLADAAECTLSDRMLLYCPVIQFHDRWNELTMSDLSFTTNGMKGSITQSFYMQNITDISGIYQNSSVPSVPSQAKLDLLEELLDYCDSEQVNLLFVLVPRAEASKETVSEFLYMKDLIQDRGYPIVDMLTDPNALNLDLSSDFYNAGHTNIHGSMKFTQYLSEYLIENYGFTDKRGNVAYAGWEEAAADYKPVLDAYALDIEHPGYARTGDLSAPEDLQAQAEDGTIRLTWEAVPGAEGYCVYRKTGSAGWQRIAEVSAPEYTDPEASDSSRVYRVVPFRTGEGGLPCYGHFSYNGVAVQS